MHKPITLFLSFSSGSASKKVHEKLEFCCTATIDAQVLLFRTFQMLFCVMYSPNPLCSEAVGEISENRKMKTQSQPKIIAFAKRNS